MIENSTSPRECIEIWKDVSLRLILKDKVGNQDSLQFCWFHPKNWDIFEKYWLTWKEGKGFGSHSPWEWGKTMTHNSFEIFWLKNYMFCTKWAHQSTIFQNFECSNEILPKSSCHFWSHKFKVYSKFASLFSVMKDNFCFFVAQALYTLDKNSPTEINFQTSELLGENTPNSSCYIWNPKSFFL